MRIPIQLKIESRNVETRAIVDSGATGIFIDHQFIERHRIRTQALAKPLEINNADGTPNKIGIVTQYMWLKTAIGK